MSSINVIVLTNGDREVVGLYSTKLDAINGFIKELGKRGRWRTHVIQKMEDDGQYEFVNAVHGKPYNIENIRLDSCCDYIFEHYPLLLPRRIGQMDV